VLGFGPALFPRSNRRAGTGTSARHFRRMNAALIKIADAVTSIHRITKHIDETRAAMSSAVGAGLDLEADNERHAFECITAASDELKQLEARLALVELSLCGAMLWLREPEKMQTME
jgi:hypothetical protein